MKRDKYHWIKLCISKGVMQRATLTALVVGSILALINYGDALIQGTITPAQQIRMLITYLVPYSVSTFSSVSTLKSLKSQNAEE